ncbi:ABC transporter permease subunit [Vibrio gallicus]|uniref:ABC transporter permease subunit n=1 Tax=Vibrio gallicus TaxID=190897 RepID=UPI0021C461B2|nr:ABC transporter permease [Vibrio gallicus]
MLGYFVKRLLLIIPTFIGITVLIFCLTRFVPGGPVERMISEMQMNGGAKSASQTLSESDINELKAMYGMDKPAYIAYADWLTDVVHLDLGVSTRYYDPVWDMVKERMPISLFYGVIALILSYGIAIPLGIYKAIHHGGKGDNISSVIIFVGYSMPNYVLGVLLLSLLAFYYDILPLGGFTSNNFEELSLLGKAQDLFSHAILPVICYTIADVAILTMTMKNNLLENLSSDYVKTAVSKGLTYKDSVYKHALRNSLIPIASHFGSVISVFLSGSFLIEVVFNIDGIGQLGYEAIIQRDYPVVMGILSLSALLLMFGNIISDLCVAAVDPRVKFGK